MIEVSFEHFKGFLSSINARKVQIYPLTVQQIESKLLITTTIKITSIISCNDARNRKRQSTKMIVQTHLGLDLIFLKKDYKYIIKQITHTVQSLLKHTISYMRVH